MSTKTNFKRIALVAVAALGLGVLSSVPSQAAPTGTSITVRNQGTAPLSALAATTSYSDSSTAAKFTLTSLMTAATDTVAVTFVTKSQPAGSTVVARMTYHDTGTAVSTGVVSSDIQGTTNLTATAAANRTDSVVAGTSLFMKASSNNTYASAGFRISLDSMTATVVAGTYTFTVLATPYTTNVAGLAITQDITIVVTDTAAAVADAVTAAGTSTAIMSAGASFTSGTLVDDAVNAAFTPSTSSAVAVIRVTQKASDGTAARESITATISIGNIGSATAASGKSLVLQPAADGTYDIGVFPDGTSGTATITIKTKTVTFTNKTVTFYSTSVDKYVVTRLAKVIGSSSTPALLVQAVDASGNVIKETTNSTVYAYSDNIDAVATAATTASGQSCTTSAAIMALYSGHLCYLTGSANGVANITIRNKSTLALSTKASTAATAVTVNLNPVAKVALSFDKATYAPGEVAYLSVVPTDASGNPVAPSTGYANLLATGGITATAAFGNGSASSDSLTATQLVLSTSTTGKVTDVGLYTIKLYMPASGGTISVSATGGTALPAANQVKVTATASVTDSGAASLAAVTALATTVASLKTLITTLTNLVLKIQKKVKA